MIAQNATTPLNLRFLWVETFMQNKVFKTDQNVGLEFKVKSQWRAYERPNKL